jgi:hypothetical protein
MAPKSKRPWYQFSLKTLLVLISVICIALGFTIRAIPLLRLAKEHEEYSRRLAGLSDNYFMGEAAKKGEVKHRDLATAYRRAAWNPWIKVPNPLPTGE